MRSASPATSQVDDDGTIVGFLTVEHPFPGLCRDLLDGGRARASAARGIGTALVERLAADEAARRHSRCLLVMTSGDAIEYAPTRALLPSTRISSREDVSRLVGAATCLSFWSDLCSLGHRCRCPSSGRTTIPVRASRTCCTAMGQPPTARSGHRSAGHPRHHLRRDPLRRRRGHGRRPPGHRGQPDQPPHDGEGVPGRPLLAASPSPARPGPAMEMVKLFQLQLEHYEKVEGSDAQPRGQGQPARPDGARQPARGDAGPRRRAALRRLRPAPATGPPLQLRRHRRPLRGDRLPRHRLGQPARRHRDQARLPRRPDPRRGRRPRHPGAVRRPPTRTPPPAGPTSCAASSRSSPRSPPTGFERVERRRASPSASGRSLDRALDREPGGPAP